MFFCESFLLPMKIRGQERKIATMGSVGQRVQLPRCSVLSSGEYLSARSPIFKYICQNKHILLEIHSFHLG